MVVANQWAHRMGGTEISAEQVLLAMVSEEMDLGVGKGVLMNRGTDLAKLRERLGWTEARVAIVAPATKLQLAESAKVVLDRAIGEARELKDNYVGTEHLLLAMALVAGTREILEETGASQAVLRAGVHVMRARCAWDVGDSRKAAREFEAAVEANEKDAGVKNDVAWMLATRKEVMDGAKAVAMAKRLCEASGFGNAHHLDTLAAAYAASGDFVDAVRWQEQVMSRASEIPWGMERLACYREGRAWVEVAQ